MNNQQIAAIIVTYNRKELLRDCIEAILRQQPADLVPDIYVIDNASTDGTQAYIDDLVQQYGCLFYQNTGANLGGAGGFSYGIRLVTETKQYRYVWIMDDDTIPKEDALGELLNARDIVEDDFGYLASTVQWIDGVFCRMNHVLLDQPGWVFGYDKIQQGIVPIHKATFVSLLIPTAVVQEVGLPIKEFFIWGDDQEYTDRIHSKYPCYYVSRSCVTHKMKTNVGTCLQYDVPERIDRYVYAFRNDWYTARRNGRHEKLLYLVNAAGIFLQILTKKDIDHKGKRMKAILKGFNQGLRFHPPIEYVEK